MAVSIPTGRGFRRQAGHFPPGFEVTFADTGMALVRRPGA